jgi:hypothetical protein
LATLADAFSAEAFNTQPAEWVVAVQLYCRSDTLAAAGEVASKLSDKSPQQFELNGWRIWIVG